MAITTLPLSGMAPALRDGLPVTGAAGAGPSADFAAVLEAVKSEAPPTALSLQRLAEAEVVSPQPPFAKGSDMSELLPAAAMMDRAAKTMPPMRVGATTELVAASAPAISPRDIWRATSVDGALEPVVVPAEGAPQPSLEALAAEPQDVVPDEAADVADTETFALPSMPDKPSKPDVMEAPQAAEMLQPPTPPAEAPLQSAVLIDGAHAAASAVTPGLVTWLPGIGTRAGAAELAVDEVDGQDSTSSPAVLPVVAAAGLPVESSADGVSRDEALRASGRDVSHGTVAAEPAARTQGGAEAATLGPADGARAEATPAAGAPSFNPDVSGVTERSSPLPYPAAVRPATAYGAEARVVLREGRFGNDIGVAIARAAEGSDRETGEVLLIRLDPRHMGRVEVKLSFAEDGALRAVVTSDSSVALDLLKRESGQLDRAFADAGVRADAQSLRFESGAGGHQRHGPRPHVPMPPLGSPSQFSDQQEVAAPLLPSLRGSGQIDLMA